MISYRTTTGTSCLWDGSPDVWSGHAPHLFPIVGTLPNGTHRYRRRNFPMSKHGFLRNTEFSVTSQSESSITMLREETDDSLAQYPFRFSFFVTHTMLETGFQTQYKVVNRSTVPMPFCIGGHPSFRCPVFASEDFSDYELVLHSFSGTTALLTKSEAPLSRQSITELPIVNGVMPLSHALLGDSVLIFENTGIHQVTLRNRKNSYAAQLSFDAFPIFAIWTFGSKQAQYLCIEPWHGMPCLDTDTPALSSKPYCILLRPGMQKELSYQAHFTEQ